MNLEDRLRNHLTEQQSGPDPVGAGPAAAMGRARQRKQRTTGMVAAVLLVMGGFAIAAFSQRADEPTQTAVAVETESTPGTVTEESSASGGTASAASLADGDWESAISSVTTFGQQLFLGDDGVYYALSTVPGEWNWDGIGEPPPPPDMAVYSSSDGSTWTHRPVNGQWISQLDEGGGVLYALGTVPGTGDQNAPTLRIGASTDAGAQWNLTEVAVTYEDPSHSLPGSLNLASSIAAGNDGLLIAAQVDQWVDVWRLLTEEQLNLGYSVEPTPEGIRIVDWSATDELWMACDAAMAGFEESDAFDLPAEPVAEEARADDAPPVPFEEVPACIEAEQAGGAEPDVIEILPWSDFNATYEDAFSSSVGGRQLFLSTDQAVSFTEVSWPFGTDYLSMLEAVEGGYVAISQERIDYEGYGVDFEGEYDESVYREPQTRVWTSSDGVNWTAEVSPFNDVRSVGSFNGQTILVGASNSGSPAIATRTGDEWTASALPSVTTEAGADQWLGSADVSQNGISITVEVFREYTEAEQLAMEEAIVEAEADGDVVSFENPNRQYVIYSADGTNWSSANIADLSPEPVLWIEGTVAGPNGPQLWVTVEQADAPAGSVLLEVVPS